MKSGFGEAIRWRFRKWFSFTRRVIGLCRFLALIFLSATVLPRISKKRRAIQRLLRISVRDGDCDHGTAISSLKLSASASRICTKRLRPRYSHRISIRIDCTIGSRGHS